MLKGIILKILGRERIEFIRSKPFLVHGKYRSIILDLEKYSKVIRTNYGTDPDLSLLLVRKFGHILDKGLHRSDAEKGHSLGIATELAKNISIAEQTYPNDDTLIWAREKLELYNKLQISGKIEPLYEVQKDLTINFNDLEALIKNRRSNRLFQSRQIDDDILKKIASTVNWASSSCNKQPIVLHATTNPELAKSCLKCCKGGTGFGDYIPAFISFTADMRGYYLPDEVFLPAIDVSLGAQNFILAAETMGLSVTSLSWALKGNEEEVQLRNLLSIPSNLQIIFNAVIGYPTKYSVTPVRKNISNTLYIQNNTK